MQREKKRKGKNTRKTRFFDVFLGVLGETTTTKATTKQ